MAVRNGSKFLVIAATALIAHSANAESTAHLYTKGQWIKVKGAEVADAFKSNMFFKGALESFTKQIGEKFLSLNSTALGLNSRAKLEMSEALSGHGLNTIRYKKSYKGIEVLGGEGLIHLVGGRVSFANMDSTILDSVDTNPRLSAKEAEAIAMSASPIQGVRSEDTSLKILLLHDGNQGQIPYLVYQTTVRETDGLLSDVHFVDAHSGREVMVTTNVHTAKSRSIMAGSGTDEDFAFDTDTYKLVYADKGCSQAVKQTILQDQESDTETNEVLALAPCSKDLDDRVLKAAKGAFDNSGIIYDYYFTKYGRKSIDNAGATLQSVVNFGSEWSNAAWLQDKKLMLYGAGDNDKLNDFSIALDVAAHELTHGLTGSTAKLTYSAESGALNESYSDAFGKLVAFNAGKSKDWKLGKELFKDGVGFVRDLENPMIGHYDDYLYKGEVCHRFNDMCGVHDNSGIPNKAAVEIINKLGYEKSGKILFMTLTQLLRPASTFKEAAQQAVVACGKIYGPKSADCVTVNDAYKKVGML